MFKKQLTTILAALFLTASPLAAQETSTTQKPSLAQFTFSEKTMALPKYMFKDAKGAVYTLKDKTGDTQWLTKFDSTLKQVFEKAFIMPKSKYELTILDIRLWKNKPMVFCSGTLKKGIGQIFYFTIEEDGTLGTLEQLGNFTPKEDYLTCGIVVSPDNSKLLVYAELVDLRNDLMGFKIFDTELKEIWHTKSTFDTYEIKQGLKNIVRTVVPRRKCVIDNKGRFWVTIPVAREDEESTKDEGDYYFEIHQFKQDTPKPKIYTIDFKRKTLYNFELCCTKKPDELLVYGTYTGSNILSTSNGDGGVMGTFQFRIDVAQSVVFNKVTQDFSDAIFDFAKINNKRKAAGNGIKNIRLITSHLTENDNLAFLLECNYKLVSSSKQNTLYTPTTSYYSDMAIIVKYGSDGKVLFQRYIPKKSNDTGGSHVLFLQKQEQEIFIFNDNIKNRTKDITTFSDVEYNDWTEENSRTYALSNTDNGEYVASIFMPIQDDVFVLQPNRLTVQYGPQSIVALVVSRKNEREMKLVRIDY